MAQVPQSFGTAFATAGFSFDANLSPNNQAFSNAIYATVVRLAQQIELAVQPFLPGGGTNATAIVLSTAVFANPTNKVSGTATNGTSTLAMRSDGAPALDWAQSPTWTGNHIFNPASGIPLNVQIAGVNRFQVNGTTTSIQGQGPIAGVLVDMTPDLTTFVVALTGVTPAVNATFTARRMGNFALITTQQVTGTSNANSFTATGIPAAWQPTFSQVVVCNLEDNSNNVVGMAQLQTNGTMVFAVPGVSGTKLIYNAAGWTASGQKGFNVTAIGPYALA